MLKRETIFMDDRRIAGEGGVELIVHDGVTFRSNEPIRVSAAFLDGNTNSWQFVGYHTYDGIIELACEIFPKATSIVLELKRTITVPGRTMVAKLSIISPGNQSKKALRRLLVDSQRNRGCMTICQLAEVNKELMLRGDKPCRRVTCDGHLVGFFAQDFELDCEVHGTTRTENRFEDVSVRLPPGQSAREWATAQLRCGTANLPYSRALAPLLKDACQDAGADGEDQLRMAYGADLRIRLDGTETKKTCRELLVLERWGSYDVVDGDTAVVHTVVYDVPLDSHDAFELIVRLREIQRPPKGKTPQAAENDQDRQRKERDLKKAVRRRLFRAYSAKDGPTLDEIELAETYFKLEDPTIRVEDEAGGLIGYVNESLLLGWVGADLRELDNRLVRIDQPSERQRASFLLATWLHALVGSLSITGRVSAEIRHMLDSSDLDVAIGRLYSDIVLSGPKRQRDRGRTIPRSFEDFEATNAEVFGSVAGHAPRSGLAWGMAANHMRSRLDSIETSKDHRQRVLGIISRQLGQPNRTTVASAILRSLNANGVDSVTLDGMELRAPALCALACLGHRKAAHLVCDLLVGAAEVDARRRGQSTQQPRGRNEDTALPEDDLPEWARSERAYILEWADAALAKDGEGPTRDIAQFIARQVGRGRLNVLVFDDSLYREVTGAELSGGTTDVTSFPFPLAVIRTPEEGDVYGIAVFRWGDLEGNRDGYGTAYVRDGGTLTMDADPRLEDMAQKLVTYLDCDNAMLDVAYVDGGIPSGRAAPTPRVKDDDTPEYVEGAGLVNGTRIIVERQQTESESAGIVRRSHFRRGFMKRQRVGPRDDWHYETRWIKPTFAHGSTAIVAERRVRKVVL